VKFLDRVLSEETLRGEANRFFRSRVGLLFQNPEAQLFSSTVREEILFGPAQLGLSREDADRRADESLSLLRIEPLAGRAPHELSIGEKKRVAIACILALNPDVLLLDEPTAGLDPRSCRTLMDIVHEAAKSGRTIISASHDLHFVSELADRVYVLGEDKRVIAEGPVTDILRDEDRLRAWNLSHIHRHRHHGDWHEHEHAHHVHLHDHDHDD
jgi:cobalt/nickel transport system ATP-binding protein